VRVLEVLRWIERGRHDPGRCGGIRGLFLKDGHMQVESGVRTRSLSSWRLQFVGVSQSAIGLEE
jgi:hypothetical protein